MTGEKGFVTWRSGPRAPGEDGEVPPPAEGVGIPARTSSSLFFYFLFDEDMLIIAFAVVDD